MTGLVSWLGRLCVAALLVVPAFHFVPHLLQSEPLNAYALSNGAAIALTPDWASQQVTHIPPPGPLASSAPRLNFSDFLVFQNVADHSQLEFGLSNNPFIGRDAYWLDTEMHRQPADGGMLAYLFYFFFPPPHACLDRASSDYERAAGQHAGDDASQTSPADVNIHIDCQYAPTISDFYSYLLSPGVTFRRQSGTESRGGALRNLYLPPMDQREINGLTFFIFEAQGTRGITVETTNRFNLPDSLQGTQPDFLWAVGAPSPFPFTRVATRKNVPLIHVVYAGMALGANRKADFLGILQNVRAPR